ncbi:hypothetical protein LXL04_037175 [Taraxacum kok-saghyz]
MQIDRFTVKMATLEAYNIGLFEKYGEDPAQHMVNDPKLWTQTQLHRQGGKQKDPMYGIGSSDLNYVVTGTYSSVSSSNSVAAADYAKSQADYAKSQEKVNELEQQLVNMQQSMDESQNAITLEMEQMKKTREELATFMREFRPPAYVRKQWCDKLQPVDVGFAPNPNHCFRCVYPVSIPNNWYQSKVEGGRILYYALWLRLSLICHIRNMVDRFVYNRFIF